MTCVSPWVNLWVPRSRGQMALGHLCHAEHSCNQVGRDNGNKILAEAEKRAELWGLEAWIVVLDPPGMI